jgi:glycosyltransferase involved in cell wall biosynthesis
MRIIHICHTCGGGTQKYVDDLIKLYPDYEHITYNNIPFSIENADKDIRLLHIHGAFFASNIEWMILEIIDQFKKFNIPVYLTIHDGQWLFNSLPYYTYDKDAEYLEYYEVHNKKNTHTLFEKVDKIFMPSESVYIFYMKYLKLKMSDTSKIHIIPHPDIPIRYEQLYIPYINKSAKNNSDVNDNININDNRKIINIAFIGVFNEYKGARLFLELIYNVKQCKHGSGSDNALYKIEYHIFGKHTPSESDEPLKSYVHFHGSYKENELIEKLYENNIHIIMALSIVQETYCYALSHMINSGLPIIYYNHGSFATRLNSEYSRMFAFNKPNELVKTLEDAIGYVIDNQGRRDLIDIGTEVELNEGYQKLYLSEK